jgi:ribose transport system substrate-binding protein
MLYYRHAGVIGLVLTLASCSDKNDAVHQNITIAWITKGVGTPVFDLGRSGATLAADDLSSASGNTVKAMIIDPAQLDAPTQIEAFQSAVDAKVQAIALSVIDAAALTPVIDEAVDAGIPVLTFDSDAPNSKRLTYYSIDNYKASQTAFQVLARLMDDAGEFALFDSTDTGANYQQREQAFQDELANHPNLTLDATFSCGVPEQDATANCTTGLDEILAAHPNVSGWYFMRGKAIWEADLETKAPNWTTAAKAGQIKAVGFDTSGNALQNMQTGYVHALIGQKYFGWGYDLVTMAYDAVAMNRKFAAITDSGFDVVCPNNLDELNALIQSKDFRTPLTKCSSLP